MGEESDEASVVNISSARSMPATEISAPELRARWRRASAEAGWSFAGDWWVPAVDAITEAIASGKSPIAGCQRLGLARAETGVQMSEALNDLEALWAVIEHAASSSLWKQRLSLAEMLRAASVGWAEHVDLHLGAIPCEDPLTALATSEYLSTRLGEIYREASSLGTQVPQTHALVVVSLMVGSPGARHARTEDTGESAAWDMSLQMVLVSEAMHRIFSAGETIAAARSHTAVAVVRRDAELASKVAMLRELIERDRLAASALNRPPVGVWVEGLPASSRNAAQLLRELGR